MQENLSPRFGNNTCKDQSAQMTSLHICADWSAHLLFPFWKVASKLAAGEISIFQLVFLAKETAMSLALLDTPKTGLIARRPYFTAAVIFFESFGPSKSKMVL